MSAKCSFDRDAVDLARSGPPLRRTQHDRRPRFPPARTAAPCGVLDRLNARVDLREHLVEMDMDRLDLLSLDEEGLVAVCA